MKMLITVRHQPTQKVLASGVYEIAAEGDLGKIIPGLMTQARAALGGGPLWEILISLDKAE